MERINNKLETRKLEHRYARRSKVGVSKTLEVIGSHPREYNPYDQTSKRPNMVKRISTFLH